MDRADHELEHSPDASDRCKGVIRGDSLNLLPHLNYIVGLYNTGILKGAIKLVATHTHPETR